MLGVVLLLCYIVSAQGFRTNLLPNAWNVRKGVDSNNILKHKARVLFRENHDFSPFHGAPSHLFMAKSPEQKSYYEGMDAYQILDVARDADLATIKKAYRKASMQWHPDKFHQRPEQMQEATDRMMAINRAWYILEDPDRRKRYDTYGEGGVGNSDSAEEELKRSGGPGFGGMGDGMGGVDLSDLFSQMFGGGGGVQMDDDDMGGINFGDFSSMRGRSRGSKRNANAPVDGEDLNVEAEVSFMTSIFGGQEKIRVRRQDECSTCTGTGMKPGAKLKSCGTCGGQGMVNQVQRTPFGMMNSVSTCPKCNGAGQEVTDHCAPCKGKGTVSGTKELNVKIPKGVESGAVMRIKEGGHAGKLGGVRGDLYVKIKVKPDPRFQREGNDIHTTEEISYINAILGTTVETPTVDGPVRLSIPAGTQPNQRLRMKGRGSHKLNSELRGDAFVTVKVAIPKKISTKEKFLLEQLAGEQVFKKSQD